MYLYLVYRGSVSYRGNLTQPLNITNCTQKKNKVCRVQRVIIDGAVWEAV